MTCDLQVPATEIQIAEAIRVSDPVTADIIRRLAFQRDRLRRNEMQKTITEKAPRCKSRPIIYHENGNVKFPATYTQLLYECERLNAELTEAKRIIGAFV